MQEKTVLLQYNPIFWLGDKFYKVEASPYKNTKVNFSSKCPSCNDTRKITYKGYNGSDFECECPICKGSNSHTYGNNIALFNWEIHEYTVYKINAQGPETVSAYKDGTGYIETFTLTAFCKIGRCKDDFIQCYVPLTKSHKVVDIDIDSIDVNSYYFAPEEYVFTKKSDAAKFLKILQERDKKRLTEFNETYETEYEYPFE